MASNGSSATTETAAVQLSFTLNGVQRTVAVPPGESLLSLLRRLGCFSVRFGSDTGETGSAAVLVDGRLVSADVLLAAQVDGHDVTTVESLNVATGEFHPIQTAFVEAGALQSGYSAGAMVLATKALLEKNPDPSEEQIRDALSGILDRETGYVKVVEAVKRAAAVLRGEKPDSMECVVVERLTAPGVAVDNLDRDGADRRLGRRSARRALRGRAADGGRRQGRGEGGRAPPREGQPRVHRRHRAP